MAELYWQQGQPERAIAIYRHVVREKPDDAQARARLAELEAAQTGKAGEKDKTMSFREHVQRVVEQVPGALACGLMGFDGIPIDSYEVGGAEVDMATLFTEYASVAHQVRRAMEDPTSCAGGSLSEMVISSPKFVTVVRPIGTEYLVAAVLSPSAMMGKARYLLRVTAPKITKELGQ
jgi:predicted regulator of Ras-like GTPase activity (Roadblock/LC7/MglB family)